MFALMIVDGKLDEKEKATALAFSQVFGIARDRALEIIKAVTAAFLRAVRKRR